MSVTVRVTCSAIVGPRSIQSKLHADDGLDAADPQKKAGRAPPPSISCDSFQLRTRRSSNGSPRSCPDSAAPSLLREAWLRRVGAAPGHPALS
jgi:hypothetical protein